MSIEISDYTFAGAFLTQSVPRPDYYDAELLPEHLISLSSCICSFFPASWVIRWCSDTDETRLEQAAVFGIPENRLSSTIDAVTKLFDTDFGWENVIYSVESARRLVRDFLPDSSKVQIVGAALHNSHIKAYLECASPPKPEPGHAPVGAHGTFQVLSQGNAAATPDEILGIEPLVYDSGLSCSWLCNGLEKECHDKLGVAPNSHGLIADSEQAKQCTDFISLDEVGAEPGLWLPWLLLRYK